MSKGKFVVLYGINNLGKSTQANLIIDYLKSKKIKACYIKYPIYGNRSGKIINDYLRNGLKLTSMDFQMYQIINKFEYADKLDQMLSRGEWVVAEDYTLTTLAWGMAYGIERTDMEKFYVNLTKPSVSILLDGERFIESKETGHKHESDNALTNRARQYHLDLAQEFKYPIINANQSINKVTQDIVKHINKVLK